MRKTSQAALLVLMEQGLVEQRAVEEKVCPVILMLTEMDSLVEFHTGAVAVRYLLFIIKTVRLLACPQDELVLLLSIILKCSQGIRIRY